MTTNAVGCGGWWKMDDNATSATVVDSTGSHNGEYQIDEVAQNTDTGDSTGKVNGALALVKASKEAILVADHADFTPALTPFSISAWINMTDASYFEIASKGMETAGTGEWVFGVRQFDQLTVEVFQESKHAGDCYIGRLYSASLASYEGTWIHVAWTYDGGTLCSGIKLYLNGKRVDDTDKESNKASFETCEAGGEPLLIGLYPVPGSYLYADGLVDNVMLFSTTLTPSQVRGLWNYGQGIVSLAEIDDVEKLFTRTGRRR